MKTKAKALMLLTSGILSLAACAQNEIPNPSSDSSLSDLSGAQSEDERFLIYQKALAAGYEGTYEEWLETIRGKDGTHILTGHEVPEDNLGSDGDIFIDIETWIFYQKAEGAWTELGCLLPKEARSIIAIELLSRQGNVDTYVIRYSDDTSSLFTVTNGKDGTQGIQGQPGQDGHTPVIVIGENGNWFVDGEDTQLPARGEQGPRGASVLSGTVAPGSDLGEDGDIYINTVTWDVYEKKEGTWLLAGNIRGEKGDDGISILSIEKTSSDGDVDTYTISYSDGRTSSFMVTNGKDGTQGIQGQPGQDGHTPTVTIGENGNWFIDGVDSGVKAQGPKGDQGDPGQDGRGIASIEKTSSEGLVDTYAIVYTDGSTSTFVVNNGQQGAQGIQGQPGQDGHTPTVTIGENGNWFIDGVDSGVKAQGPKGDQGDPGQDGRGVVSIKKTASEGLTDTYTITYTDGTTSTFVVTNGQDGQQGAPGIQGQPGQDGHTPSIAIGENGNWFIDGVDSGVSCRGADGQQGEKGNDGVSIVTVLLTSSDGLTDTYTIYYSDENTSTFTVKNGQNGIDGIQGIPGEDGHSPVVSIVDGYWSIDGVNTGIGALGEDGKTPYIGDNGNWWIGEEDTGILSRGNSICAFMFDPEGSAEADSLALGDLWLNTMTGDLFVKRDGVWQKIGNLRGLDGIDGHTPYIDGGYWYIAGENTGIMAQGPKGDPGEKGENGLTPYIGANGHWWIGEDDTGFVAVGQDGEDGQDGVSIVGCYCAETTDAGATYRLEFSDGQVFDFFIPKGEKGEDGLTPTVTINEQGHWVINGEDTLVDATGAQGNSITGITLERQTETDSTYRITFSDGTSSFFTVNHGRNGQDGVSIVDIRLTSSEGLVDTYTIYYSDESTSTFTVTNGTQGAQGIQGEPGQDGHTPTIRIGENGNWVIDDVDTGILAKGPKGDPGEPGQDGKSAYQIYCEVYGYTGTEEQWIHDLVNGLLGEQDVHTVTFETGEGGSAVDPQIVRDGGKAIRPKNPTRPGYIFKDWVDEYGEHWAFNGFSITEDITLYAKWEVDTYALAFPDFYDDSADDYAYRSLAGEIHSDAKQSLYERLDKCYRGLVENNQDFAEDYFFTVDYSDLDLAMNEAFAVYKYWKLDHPLAYFASTEIRADETSLYLIADSEYRLASNRQEYQSGIASGVQEYLDYAAMAGNTYDISLAFHDYLLANAEYHYDAYNQPSNTSFDHNVIGVFLYHEGVCESYARAFQALLNLRGVENICVTGIANGDAHIWNYVRDGSRWYAVDVTFDDGIASRFDRHAYFMRSNDERLFHDDFGWTSQTGTFHTEHQVESETSEGLSKLYVLPELSAYAYHADEVVAIREEFIEDGFHYVRIGYEELAVTRYDGYGEIKTLRISDGFWFKGVNYRVAAVCGFADNKFNDAFLAGKHKETVPLCQVEQFIFGCNVSYIGQVSGNLKAFYFADVNPYYTVKDNVLFTADLDILIQYPNLKEGDHYIVPDQTRHISSSAFSGAKITSIYLGDNLEWFTEVSWGSGHLYPKQGTAIINVLAGDILRLSGLGYIDRLYFEVSEDNTTVFAHEGSLYSYQDEVGRYTLLQAYVPEGEYTLELIEGTTGVIEGAYQDTFVQLVIPSTVTDFSTVIGYLPTLKEIVDHTNADAASYVANYRSESMFHVITDAKDSTLRDVNGYMLMGVGDDVVFITDVEKRVHVVLPDEVTLLPSRAFVDSHIRSLYIGANVEKVEYLAVFRCEDLLSVTFAGTPEYSPFVECPKLSLLYGDVGYFSSNYIWSSNRRNFFFEPVDSTLRIEEKDGSWYLERESRTYLLDYEGASYDYVIPSFVSDIGDYAFMGESFHSVTFSENILSMGIKCFERAMVDQVLWPGTISCSSWSFADCDGLEEAYMPQATLIPANAFAWCSMLSKVTFASIVYIRDSAFAGCTSLTNFDFGTQLKVIERYAFQGTGLEQVYLPDSLESLSSYAFAFCTDLASIRIPSSVLEFNETVLSGDLALKNIILPTDHPALSFDDGVLYNRDKTTLLVYLSSKEDAEYIMPSSVTSISYAAIRGNSYLKTLQFSDNIEVLEGNEVSSCPSLSKVYLPENLRRLGEKNQTPAFEGCDSLQYYRYEDGNYLGSRSNPIMALIKNVNMYAEEFTIPEGCRFIAQRGFDYSGYGGLTNLKTLNLPSTLWGIGCYGLCGCKNLTDLTLPEGFLYIGDYAFNGCDGLVTLSVPESIESLDISTIMGLPNLERASEGGFTYIGNADNPYVIMLAQDAADKSVGYVAEGCVYLYGYGLDYSVEAIYLPTSLVTLTHTRFPGRFYFGGSKAQWEAIGCPFADAYHPAFYSETEPTSTESLYWHYDAESKPVLWNE